MFSSKRTCQPRSSLRGAFAARLVALVAVIAVVAGIGTVGDARAALGSSYYVGFPAGACEGNRIEVPAPTAVSPSAQDTRIAWRIQLWRYTQSGWVKDVPTAWQWADVSYGAVHAPWGASASFTINRAGYYGVTGEVYSYGLGDYRRDIPIDLSVSVGFGQYAFTGWCGFGV